MLIWIAENVFAKVGLYPRAKSLTEPRPGFHPRAKAFSILRTVERDARDWRVSYFMSEGDAISFVLLRRGLRLCSGLALALQNSRIANDVTLNSLLAFLFAD